MSTKKKILILIDWFYPGFKAGGPIQSCVNMVKALKDDYDIFVMTTDTDHGELQPYEGIPINQWIINEELGAQLYYAQKKHLTFAQVSTQIKNIHPDFLYLNQLFSLKLVLYPLFLKLLNKISCKVILNPRGTLYDSALSHKKYKKIPFLFFFRLSGINKKILFHATNEREQKAIEYNFPNSQIFIADNLPNLLQDAFESIKKTPGILKCVFVARIVTIKNLFFLLKAIENVKTEISLNIIGPKEDVNYWNECVQIIKKLNGNTIVNYLGALSNHEIKRHVLESHLFVLPTLGENFGHAIFESFLAGRPALISDQTPWLNLESKKAGWDLPLDNISKFTEKLEFLSAANQEQYDVYAKGAWQLAHTFINDISLKKNYLILFS